VFSFLPYAPSRQKEIHNLWKPQAVHSDRSQTSYFRLQFGQRLDKDGNKEETDATAEADKKQVQLPSLTKTEADLLWHMGHGYQLETSSLGDNPVLRRLKDNTEVRAIANRRTIETLQQRGLIAVAKAGGVLNPTVWRFPGRHPERLPMRT
jgi:hypothetical protein